MSVKQILPGCAAAVQGVIRLGDVLLSVGVVNGDAEPFTVHAHDNLSVLFPQGDQTFELRFLRKERADSSGGSAKPRVDTRPEWSAPERRVPSLIATAETSSLGAGSHAFVHVPIHDATGTVRLPAGAHAAVHVQAGTYHLNSVRWLTSAEPSNLSDGLIPGCAAAARA
eukprot:6967075-Prymnesium_polylepis.1